MEFMGTFFQFVSMKIFWSSGYRDNLCMLSDFFQEIILRDICQ